MGMVLFVCMDNRKFNQRLHWTIKLHSLEVEECNASFAIPNAVLFTYIRVIRASFNHSAPVGGGSPEPPPPPHLDPPTHPPTPVSDWETVFLGLAADNHFLRRVWRRSIWCKNFSLGADQNSGPVGWGVRLLLEPSHSLSTPLFQNCLPVFLPSIGK